MATEPSLQTLVQRLRDATGLHALAGSKGVLVDVRSLREACDVERFKTTLPPDEAALVGLSLSANKQLAAPNLESCTVAVGGGALLEDVEAFLKGYALTLGALSPRARQLTVSDWLHGHYAGLRVIPGNRLEPAALSISVALASGGSFVSHPTPRQAAGPDLTSAFIGAGRRAGVIVAATLRCLPRFEARERLHATFARPSDAVAALRACVQRDVPLVEAHVERRRSGGAAMTVVLGGPTFRARRDHTAVEEELKRHGEPQPLRPTDTLAHPREVEVGWEDLAKVLEGTSAAALYRIARESVVVACDAAPEAGVVLEGEPGGLPKAFVEALSRGQVR